MMARMHAPFTTMKEENIWVGSVTYNEKTYFSDIRKKTVLTPITSCDGCRRHTPLKSALVNVTFSRMERVSGLMPQGDTQSLQSGTIEALKSLGNEKIKNIEIVFDDMGTFHVEDGTVYAKGYWK